MNCDATSILENGGIKLTSNRILVLKALLSATSPMSLLELESELQTLQRSSILRVLTLLVEKDIIHMIEDGRGISKYEICHGKGHCSIDDMHVHFYCEKCNKVYCFEDVAAPHVKVPDSFHVKSVNFMLKGICPDCRTD